MGVWCVLTLVHHGISGGVCDLWNLSVWFRLIVLKNLRKYIIFFQHCSWWCIILYVFISSLSEPLPYCLVQCLLKSAILYTLQRLFNSIVAILYCYYTSKAMWHLPASPLNTATLQLYILYATRQALPYPSTTNWDCLKVELITMVILLPHTQLYVPICQSSSLFAILETSGCGKVEQIKMFNKNILALGGHRHPRHQLGLWLPCKQLTAKSQPHGEWSANVPKRVYFM